MKSVLVAATHVNHAPGGSLNSCVWKLAFFAAKRGSLSSASAGKKATPAPRLAGPCAARVRSEILPHWFAAHRRRCLTRRQNSSMGGERALLCQCKALFFALTKRRRSLHLTASDQRPRRKSPAYALSGCWRRRRNRPGNAQAKGPLGDDTLERGLLLGKEGPPKEVTLRGHDGRAEEIFQVPGQRGHARESLARMAI